MQRNKQIVDLKNSTEYKANQKMKRQQKLTDNALNKLDKERTRKKKLIDYSNKLKVKFTNIRKNNHKNVEKLNLLRFELKKIKKIIGVN